MFPDFQFRVTKNILLDFPDSKGLRKNFKITEKSKELLYYLLNLISRQCQSNL